MFGLAGLSYAPQAQAAIHLGAANATSLSNGLVGYWPLDGSVTNWATGRTTDLSGNGGTGQLNLFSTTTSPTAGKVGQALNFDGNAYITTGYTIPAQSSATSFTWSTWFNIDPNTGSTVVLLGFRNGATWAKLTPSRFEYGTGAIITYAPPTSQWVHLTIVKSGSSFTYYQNGVVVGQATNATSVVTQTFFIGGDPGFADGFLIGKMDDVRVYNRALSATEVKQLYSSGTANAAHSNTVSNANGLVGYWPLDGAVTNWATGQTLDLTGNGNTGQLLLLSTSTAPVVGKVGQAFQFDGASNYILSTTPVTAVANWTLSAWIKPATLPQLSNAVYNGNDSGGFGFGVGNGAGVSGSKLQLLFGSVNWLDTGYTLTNNKWYHVVVARDSGTTRVYVNGVVLATTFADTPLAVVNKFTIGDQLDAANSPYRFFNGTVDDVRIYNRTLSATEVNQLYSSGVTNVGHSNTVSNANGLVGYWPFDGSVTNWATGQTQDMSGRGNNGQLTLIGTSSGPIAGKIGQALKFSGATTQYVQAGGQVSLGTDNQPYTISAWVFSTTTSATGDVVHVSDGSDGVGTWCLSLLQVQAGKAFAVGWTGAGSTATGATTLLPNKWYMITTTWDPTGGLRIYVNGGLDGSTPQATYTSSGATDFISIGSPHPGGTICDSDSGVGFTGYIDDVRVYNRSLPATELKQLYNGGR